MSKHKFTIVEIIPTISIIIGAIIILIAATGVLLNNNLKNIKDVDKVTYEYDTVVNATSMKLYDEEDTIYAFIVSETGENYLIKVEK